MASVLSADVRLRREYFGALAWRPGRPEVHRLDELAAAAALYYLHPRCDTLGSAERATLGELFGATSEQWLSTCSLLREHALLQPYEATPPSRSTLVDFRKVSGFLQSSKPPREIAKPFWVHIQPFGRCNQRCLHCYCEGSPSASPLQVPLDTWHGIIDRLDAYGVLEVYVTGGETLAFSEFFDIAQDIVDRGLGFGLSTNATATSKAVLSRLANLRIRKVQVSLDGGSPATHDHIRGSKGAFRRFQKGLKDLSAVCEPVINTVVSRWNLSELEDIVVLGKDAGCREFKFFPQKPVGRSLLFVDQCLTDKEICETLVPLCRTLGEAHSVQIDTVNTEVPCGSGLSGFAVDELGDVYPCIFGIRGKNQRCGNIIRDDLNDLWFTSPVLENFRTTTTPPSICRRCERLC